MSPRRGEGGRVAPRPSLRGRDGTYRDPGGSAGRWTGDGSRYVRSPGLASYSTSECGPSTRAAAGGEGGGGAVEGLLGVVALERRGLVGPEDEGERLTVAVDGDAGEG